MNGDAELLRAYAETRSEAAFTEFVQRHLSLVYFAALRRTGGNSALAEEVAQYVFTEAARRARMLADHGSLTGWLYTTTRNAAVMALRKERTRQRREEEASRMHELQSNEPVQDWETLRPLIDEALDHLPDRDRDAVLMRFFEGQPFAEIGTTLRISEDAARMRVERALDKLHALLAKRGVTSTAAVVGAALANQAVATAPAGVVASVTSVALGGAAAGAGSAAMIMSFMSATKVGISLGAAGALATGVAVFQNHRASAVAAELADARRDQASLMARIGGVEAAVQAAKKELTERQAKPAQVSAAPAAPAAGKELSADAQTALAQTARYNEALGELWRTDPEWHRTTLIGARAVYQIQYRPLFESLGFTPEQREKACDLLAQQRNERIFSRGSESLRVDDPPAEFWAQFGPDVVERVKQFQNTRAARSFIQELSAQLYFADEPFTPQQLENLVDLVGRARPAGAPPGMWGGNATTLFRRTLDWDMLLAEAAKLVSAGQLAGLRAMSAQARLDTQIAAAAVPPTPSQK